MARRAKVGRKCPRCSSVNTKQLTNYGRPIDGRFQCFDCKRWWDELSPEAPDYVKRVAS